MDKTDSICVNGIWVKQNDIDDPVAHATNWRPYNTTPGPEFKELTLKEGHNRLFIEPSIIFNTFTIIIYCTTVSGVVIILSSLFSNDIFGVLFGIVFTFLFGLAGVLMNQSQQKQQYSFNKDDQVFVHELYPKVKSLPLDKIHAIQLIRKTQWDRDGKKTYRSTTELNLVLENGERISIMDFAKHGYIDKTAVKLSDFLSIPIWAYQYEPRML